MVVQRACSTRAVVDPGLFYGFYGNPLLREYLSAIKYVYVHVQTDAHTNVHVTLSWINTNLLQVATTLLVAGSTLTFWILPSAHTQVLFKALGCSYNCRQLTYGSFQLTLMSHDDHAVQLIKPLRPKQRQNIIKMHSQHCHKGEFWHVSISAQQRSLKCGQNLRGPFLKATLLTTVGSTLEQQQTAGRQKGS